MKHGITRRILGCTQFVEISEEEFNEIFRAKNYFFDLLGIEEKFDLVTENYAEFENEVLGLTLRESLFHDGDWISFRKNTNTINRRFANLLSACRLYIDHIKHDISTIYGKESKIFVDLSAAFSQEYDSRLGYCVLEALRNHIQHCGLPLDMLQYLHTIDFPGNDKNLSKCTCIPSMSISRLRDRGAFKEQVLRRLEGSDDLVDIRPLVRQYVAGIGAVHKQLRKWMDEDIKRWRRLMLGAKDKFCAQYGNYEIGIAVVERDEHDHEVRAAAIFDDSSRHYDMLISKNSHPEAYCKQFVSNEASSNR